jgi:hypothetical protein
MICEQCWVPREDDDLDDPGTTLSHGGYRFTYKQTLTLGATPKDELLYLGNATVYEYICTQSRERPAHTPIVGLDKQCHRRAMEFVQCGGRIRIYIPSPTAQPRTFRINRDTAEAVVKATHRPHVGRSGANCTPQAIREWILANPCTSLDLLMVDLRY